jgi:hypothetical protein
MGEGHRTRGITRRTPGAGLQHLQPGQLIYPSVVEHDTLDLVSAHASKQRYAAVPVLSRRIFNAACNSDCGALTCCESCALTCASVAVRRVRTRHLHPGLLDQVGPPPMAFTAVASDLDSGQEVWLCQDRLFDAVRAFMATPVVFTPAQHGDRHLIDGAVVNRYRCRPRKGMRRT